MQFDDSAYNFTCSVDVMCDDMVNETNLTISFTAPAGVSGFGMTDTETVDSNLTCNSSRILAAPVQLSYAGLFSCTAEIAGKTNTSDDIEFNITR